MPARVSRESILTGLTRTMEITKYDQDEFDSRLIAYNEGKYTTLKEAFPLLSDKALSFLRDGTLPTEWDYNE